MYSTVVLHSINSQSQAHRPKPPLYLKSCIMYHTRTFKSVKSIDSIDSIYPPRISPWHLQYITPIPHEYHLDVRRKEGTANAPSSFVPVAAESPRSCRALSFGFSHKTITDTLSICLSFLLLQWHAIVGGVASRKVRRQHPLSRWCFLRW